MESIVKQDQAPHVDAAARSRARRRAVQGLYAWQMSGSDMEAIIEQFRHEQDMEIADLGYFESALRGVGGEYQQLEADLAPFLDREMDRVDPIERSILRLAAWELRHRPDVPYRVVINEAIELAKRFGADFGHTWINGVLDKAAAGWRAEEYARTS